MEDDNERKARPGLFHGAVHGLSVAIILIGIVCIGMGIASLTIALTSECQYRDYSYNEYSYDEYGHRQYKNTSPPPIVHMCTYYGTWSSPGIWSGLTFLASGIIGVLTAKRRTTCFIVVMMILSILTVLVATGGITVAVMSMLIDKSYDQLNSYPTTLYILDACVSLACFVTFILSWITFGFGCRAVCCNGRKMCPSFGQTQYQPLTNQPVMMSATSQMSGINMPGDGAKFDHTTVQPIYLVQGNQVIGVLPQNIQQANVGLAPGYAPPQTQQM